jgi:hypothetical protein
LHRAAASSRSADESAELVADLEARVAALTHKAQQAARHGAEDAQGGTGSAEGAAVSKLQNQLEGAQARTAAAELAARSANMQVCACGVHVCMLVQLLHVGQICMANDTSRDDRAGCLVR